MSRPALFTIHIDGAARGNPGPAAFAYVIASGGQPPIEDAGHLGETTNNVAEYTALVRALERARDLGGQELLIRSDSELLVKQMNGQYRVKNEQLKTLHEQARRLCQPFASVLIRHVPREQNSRADRLCNEVLDGVRNAGGSSARRKPAPAAEPEESSMGDVWEKLVDCLREAAIAWAAGDPQKPPPEEVGRRLWSLLEEKGLLRLHQR
jgi:ribonuclease HI